MFGRPFFTVILLHLYLVTCVMALDSYVLHQNVELGAVRNTHLLHLHFTRFKLHAMEYITRCTRHHEHMKTELTDNHGVFRSPILNPIHPG
jgi:hypothetical protein